MPDLSSEALNLNNTVGFWCLGSQQSPQGKSAPLKVKLRAWGWQDMRPKQFFSALTPALGQTNAALTACSALTVLLSRSASSPLKIMGAEDLSMYRET